MTPTNLPDLYSRVTAKRPDLAVNRRVFGDMSLEYQHQHGGWCFVTDNVRVSQYLDDTTAASLILAKWVEALPMYHALCHNYGGWEVCELGFYSDHNRTCTPLEALAAFWLEAP
jgi:hypothetical protein